MFFFVCYTASPVMALGEIRLACTGKIVSWEALDQKKIVFLPLHSKLGLIKQIVKAMNKDGDCLACNWAVFSGLSDERKKASVFDGPQI